MTASDSTLCQQRRIAERYFAGVRCIYGKFPSWKKQIMFCGELGIPCFNLKKKSYPRNPFVWSMDFPVRSSTLRIYLQIEEIMCLISWHAFVFFGSSQPSKTRCFTSDWLRKRHFEMHSAFLKVSFTWIYLQLNYFPLQTFPQSHRTSFESAGTVTVMRQTGPRRNSV